MKQRQVEAEADERPTSGTDMLSVVVFSIDGQRYGLLLSDADRALPMAAVSPLPGCPDVVLGALNVHGQITPVLDLRRRLGLEPREYDSSARLLLARTPTRAVALAVDEVHGVTEIASGRIVPPDAVVPGVGQLSGLAALPDGLLLISDLAAVLSIDEERRLDDAIARGLG